MYLTCCINEAQSGAQFNNLHLTIHPETKKTEFAKTSKSVVNSLPTFLQSLYKSVGFSDSLAIELRIEGVKQNVLIDRTELAHWMGINPNKFFKATEESVQQELKSFLKRIKTKTPTLKALNVSLDDNQLVKIIHFVEKLLNQQNVSYPLERHHYHRKETTGLDCTLQIFSDKRAYIHLKKKGPISEKGKTTFKTVTKSIDYHAARILANGCTPMKDEDNDVIIENEDRILKVLGKQYYEEISYYQSKRGYHYKQSILMRYWDSGDLTNDSLIQALTAQETHTLIKELLIDLIYIHSKGVIFGDIKDENTLLESTGSNPRYKGHFIDFGLGYFQNQGFEGRGTPMFHSPEAWKRIDLLIANPNKKYPPLDGIKIDMWAFGCIAYKLWFKENLPWMKLSSRKKVIQAINDPATFSEPSDKNSIPHLIWEMLRQDPVKRITPTAALEKLLNLI